MGLAHEKKSYLQEKANLFEIGSYYEAKALKCQAPKRKKKKYFADCGR
ncbi:hypothetical protein [uncultured Victivallis sp.]|nr:hypothetical protein [uncultured Victivallis sp.]